MKLTRVLHQHNHFKLFLLLLISLTWAAISVHTLAIFEYFTIPLSEIMSAYYDDSYYLSTRNRYLSGDEFRELEEYLQSLPYFEGADYLLYTAINTGNKMVGNVVFCSDHLSRYYQIPTESYLEKKQQNIYFTISSARYCKLGDSFTLTLSDGTHCKMEVFRKSWPWEIKPTYLKRYFEGSAQLIYGQDSEVPAWHYVIGARALLDLIPKDKVFYPCSMTLFFKRALKVEEEANLTRRIEKYADLTSIDRVRNNSLKEFNRASRAKFIPLISTVVFFFASLSMSLLINYKTRKIQKVLRLNGMTRMGLEFRLLLPFTFIAAISTLLFSIYIWLINALILPERVLAKNASYHPFLIVKFIAIYMLLLGLVFILTSLVNRVEERRLTLL